MSTFVIALAGNLAEACTPSQGMGCYPCCGVTSNTTAIAQSGNMGLGAVALILLVVFIWNQLKRSGR